MTYEDIFITTNSYFCGAMLLSTNHVEPLIPPLV